jgi:hypothetical protein
MTPTQTAASRLLDLEDVSPSLRNVAAYLQGVADATAALSGPPTSGLVADEASPASHPKTLPYDGGGGRADTIPAGPLVAPFPAVAQEGAPCANDSLSEPFVDERTSEVRLRTFRLSSQWYELVGNASK